ncbi:MAG: VOC family protein [Polyangiaceae bacterium]
MDTCVSSLSYVGIETRDLRAWERFATRILGLQPSGTTEDGGRLFRMDENHHRLAVHPGRRDDIVYAGWEVADDRALEALAAHLAQRGHAITWASPAAARARRVARYVEVTDPNGVVCEVVVGPDRCRDSFAPSRAMTGFVAGALGLGHIVLCTGDPDATLAFYRDGLGLRISDYIGVDFGTAGTHDVAFLHAGPRHHALAVVPLATPKRLHHLMLQVATLGDVGTAYDLCQDDGVPIAMTLGEHTNDRMVSFYMESPSGFQIEYGHGGIEIDDEVWEIAHYDAASVWGHRARPAQ